jgi:hypothetical protein
MTVFASLVGVASVSASTAQSRLPDTIAAPAMRRVAQLHGEGAQVYQCKADASGTLAWEFREPIATLTADGKTVGRHYAGPSWELAGGSTIVGKVVANSPGATAQDIPWLKLEIAAHRGAGQFDNVTTVQRIETKGGVAPAGCSVIGSYLSVAYSAEYVFLGPE